MTVSYKKRNIKREFSTTSTPPKQSLKLRICIDLAISIENNRELVVPNARGRWCLRGCDVTSDGDREMSDA